MSASELELVPGWEYQPTTPPVVDHRLTNVSVADGARVVGDPRMALPSHEEFEATKASEYERGFLEGRAAGHEDCLQRAGDLNAALQTSYDQIRRQLDAERQTMLSGIVDLAVEVATAIMARTPHDDGAALAERLRSELAAGPDVISRVEVSEADHATVERVMAPHGVAVATNRRLHPGEVVLDGDWATAELTLESMRRKISEHVTAELTDRTESP